MQSTIKIDPIAHYFSKIHCELIFTKSLALDSHLNYLQKIFLCHIQMFPFHNFELREASHSHPLNRNHLTLFNMHSYVRGQNGGFCFQNSEILYQALKYVGFNVYRSIAKILNGLSPDSLEAKKIPATHLILLVIINNQKYLLDPSIAMNGHCSPFLISDAKENIYTQNNRRFKIEIRNDEFIFHREINKSWSILFCSSLTPANETTIKLQLIKLECFPLTLGIRDIITLAGIATPNGGKCLLWNPNANIFTLKIVSSNDIDYEKFFDNANDAYNMICNDFKIEHISMLDFKKYCGISHWPQAKKCTDLDFPIDKYEVSKMKKNYFF